MKKYAFWNNKGGTGKSSLAFQAMTMYAEQNEGMKILAVDLCPQANLSELLLGGYWEEEALICIIYNRNLLEKVLAATFKRGCLRHIQCPMRWMLLILSQFQANTMVKFQKTSPY